MQDSPAFPISRLERAVQYLLLLTLFCVPFSTWLTNVFAGLCVLCFAGALATSAPLRAAVRTPPALLALGLLALLAIGASWSIGPQADIVSALKKYARLLVLPIAVATSMRDRAMPARALAAFLGGATVLATSNYLVWHDLMPTSRLGWWRIGDAKDAFSFKNHITIGILLSFATVVSMLGATYVQGARARVACLVAGVLFSVPIIFLNQGRTGYVTLFVGMVVLFLLRVRFTVLRTIFGVGAIVLLFVGFYASSNNFKARTDDLITEVRTDQKRSPNGLRMSYLRAGTGIIVAHPLAGLGTGSFAEVYAPTARQDWPEDKLAETRHQPHSEFLLIGAQLGLPGLLLYFAMLGSLLRPALAVRSFHADALVLLWAIYVVSSSFNSLLWDVTEAYWFLLLAGSLYASARFSRQPAQAPATGT
ncbi:O-antigen ligase family protein [Massilia scottii]|uniref:O-antigen ligase family protein n=1 Tax=Massilia scottii TaxID=3057166 RepID=UPI0027966555|nr:O-antigen ligase family protein [Massilia sp. CCM 9029]MDQ1829517.1 O-antigen ligase family protein [Massilia sp. CCM 9029]